MINWNSKNKFGKIRKNKSEKYLKSLGIPINKSLPIVTDSEADNIRPAKEVAERVIVLYALGVALSKNADRKRLRTWLKESNLWDKASEFEKKVISQDFSEHDRVQATWRVEAQWALLWCLGEIESIEDPVKIIDRSGFDFIQKTLPLLDEDPSEYVSNSSLRPKSEILDLLDLTYRMHWAIRDSSLSGKPMPGDLEPGVVQERHHALNWIVRYYEEDDWDSVPTDT